MKPLRINLLPPRPVSWSMLAAAAVLGLLAMGSLAAAGRTWLELRSVKAQIQARAQQQAEAAERAQRQPFHASEAAVPAYDTDARRAWNEALFATSGALTALESISMPGITPVAVELQADTRLVRLELEYSEQAMLLQYLEQLNQGEPVPRWRLMKAAAIKAGKDGAGKALLESSW